jgi:hypothetical protein
VKIAIYGNRKIIPERVDGNKKKKKRKGFTLVV